MNYQQQVFELTKQIPMGRICTYGIIATFLELGSARMVGWALNKSFTNSLHVPAHRVVNRKGELSGRNHFQTPDMMQRMLEAEGIEVTDNKIVGFDKLLWYPEEER